MGEYKMSKKPRTEDYADLRREREVREEIDCEVPCKCRLKRISRKMT